MFTKQRRKSSLFSNSSYRSYNRRRNQIPTAWLWASVPLVLLATEILLRVGIGLAGKGAEIAAYEGEPAIVTDYRFKPLTTSRQTIQGLPSDGRLAVQNHPLTGYQLLPEQKNTAVAINAQGFRSDGAIAISKPKNEMRVLVIGGATVFGSLSGSNQVIFSQQLENRLNQQVQQQKNNPGKFRPDVLPYFADELEKVLKLPPKIRDANYRVINAAVPGYVSSNTLSDLSSRLLQYQPDLIVLVDGYADLLLPSQQAAATLGVDDRVASQALGHLGSSLSEGVKSVWNWFYISKALRYWVLKPQPNIEQLVDPLNQNDLKLADRLAQAPEELAARGDRYQRNIQQIARLANANKVPLIVAIQPELSQRKVDRQTPEEKQRLEALGKDYGPRVQAGYQVLQKSVDGVKTIAGTSVVKLQPTFDKLNGAAFQDTVHWTDAAQSAVAEQLYEAIGPRMQVQPKPFVGE